MKQVAVVGAGPGGLTAAMLLAKAGYEVTVFEKQSFVGGRTSELRLGEFTFDRGPTFLNMLYLIEEIFNLSGYNIHDYMTFKELTPLYELVYENKRLTMTNDYPQMVRNLEQTFPGNVEGYKKYLQHTHQKLVALSPLLQKEMSSIFDLLSLDAIKAVPQLEIGKSLMQQLAMYFNEEELQLAFTFQSKYLGMSPWSCPGAFSILSYIEQAYGIYHIEGGLNQLTKGLAKVAQQLGVNIRLNSAVKKIHHEKNHIAAIELETGEVFSFDDLVINADFGYAMEKLLSDETHRKWSPSKIEKKQFSCSTYMIYLGLNTQYDIGHHTILFADDYRKNMAEISDTKLLSEDMSIYIHNPIVNDRTLAPEGKSPLYVLVPTPNNFSAIEWEEVKESYSEFVIDVLEKKLGLTNIREHIEEKLITTPLDWETHMNVYKGATFNLGHQLNQMMTFRPQNRFKPYDNCWLVGGGTHPGSGLPIILESARITVNSLLKRDGQKVFPVNPLPSNVKFDVIDDYA